MDINNEHGMKVRDTNKKKKLSGHNFLLVVEDDFSPGGCAPNAYSELGIEAIESFLKVSKNCLITKYHIGTKMVYHTSSGGLLNRESSRASAGRCPFQAKTNLSSWPDYNR